VRRSTSSHPFLFAHHKKKSEIEMTKRIRQIRHLKKAQELE
jgi:hypothetical protein